MTSLPIDYENRPWRQKYIDEETDTLSFWWTTEQMQGGPRKDGTVDIMQNQHDLIHNVPVKIANEMVTARNAFVDVMIKYLCNFQEPGRDRDR